MLQFLTGSRWWASPPPRPDHSVAPHRGGFNGSSSIGTDSPHLSGNSVIKAKQKATQSTNSTYWAGDTSPAQSSRAHPLSSPLSSTPKHHESACQMTMKQAIEENFYDKV